MNNVTYRNQPSYSDAPPHAWMIQQVWTWAELGFMFDMAEIRHTQDVGHNPRLIIDADFAVEASFDETFDINREGDPRDSVGGDWLAERAHGALDTRSDQERGSDIFDEALGLRARWGHD